MNKRIYGIQQIGIGVENLDEAWKWYRKNFGFDIRIFDDAGTADLMQKYTGGEIHSRRAILALNMRGGGGIEIWQYTSRKPNPSSTQIMLGDLGIFAPKLRVNAIQRAHEKISRHSDLFLSPLHISFSDQKHFYTADPYGNFFDLVEEETFFKNTTQDIGGVTGAIIGVSDMPRSIQFYNELLGFDSVLQKETGVFKDFFGLPGGNDRFTRVLLGRSGSSSGPFSPMISPGTIELVQSLERKPDKIFANRDWGDPGYIHLCFDVYDIEYIKQAYKQKGHAFSLDSMDSDESDSFEMGDATGRFAYVEDPDGTLIEFVETHRIPIQKKWGLFLNLQKREAGKPLPKWILGLLRFNRFKA